METFLRPLVAKNINSEPNNWRLKWCRWQLEQGGCVGGFEWELVSWLGTNKTNTNTKSKCKCKYTNKYKLNYKYKWGWWQLEGKFGRWWDEFLHLADQITPMGRDRQDFVGHTNTITNANTNTVPNANTGSLFDHEWRKKSWVLYTQVGTSIQTKSQN